MHFIDIDVINGENIQFVDSLRTLNIINNDEEENIFKDIIYALSYYP
jgi:hypothetical protein